tara:strand:- start:58623 stop:59501 length:879 start_codon:yes stop_codon:yes gene_type:complete
VIFFGSSAFADFNNFLQPYGYTVFSGKNSQGKYIVTLEDSESGQQHTGKYNDQNGNTVKLESEDPKSLVIASTIVSKGHGDYLRVSTAKLDKEGQLYASSIVRQGFYESSVACEHDSVETFGTKFVLSCVQISPKYCNNLRGNAQVRKVLKHGEDFILNDHERKQALGALTMRSSNGAGRFEDGLQKETGRAIVDLMGQVADSSLAVLRPRAILFQQEEVQKCKTSTFGCDNPLVIDDNDSDDEKALKKAKLSRRIHQIARACVRSYSSSESPVEEAPGNNNSPSPSNGSDR